MNSATKVQQAQTVAQNLVTRIVCPNCTQRHYTSKIDLRSGDVVLHTSCSESYGQATYVLGKTVDEVIAATVRLIPDHRADLTNNIPHCAVASTTPLGYKVEIKSTAMTVDLMGVRSTLPTQIDLYLFYGFDPHPRLDIMDFVTAVKRLMAKTLNWGTGVLPFHTSIKLYFGKRYITMQSSLPNHNRSPAGLSTIFTDKWSIGEFWITRSGNYHFYDLLKCTKVFQTLYLVGQVNRYRYDSNKLLGYKLDKPQ